MNPTTDPTLRSGAFARYLSAVRLIPKPSREQELELVERWQLHADRSARDKLLAASLHPTVAIAIEYRRYGVPIDELVAEGNLGVVLALAKFDRTRGLRFMTYASFWVRARMLAHVLASFSLGGGQSGAFRSKAFFKLRRERARISTLVGEGEEADLMLARSLGVPVDKVKVLVRQLEARNVSLDSAPFDDSRASLLDRLASPEPTSEEVVSCAEERQRLQAAVGEAVARLGERERFIVKRRLLADEEDELSLAEMGRHLGVSRERVRQLEVRAKRRLSERLAADPRGSSGWRNRDDRFADTER
jgi:RNA polymerase sigma-32 factor